MMHIYETAGWWDTAFAQWKENDYQQRYFKLMEEHRDKIVFEVAGHDHLSDFRTNKIEGTTDQYYLNKVIFPGFTSATFQMPGYATFWYDTDTGKATEVKMTFVNLQDSYGKPESTEYTDLKWLEVDYNDKFGLEDLSGEQMQKLADMLLNDQSKARKFALNKMGVDPNDTVQMADAIDAFKSQWDSICQSSTVDDVFNSQADFVIQYCYMTETKQAKEFQDCVDEL